MSDITHLVNSLEPSDWQWLVISMILAWLAGIVTFRVGRSILRRISAAAPVAQSVLTHIDRSASYAVPLILVQAVVRTATDNITGIATIRQTTAVLLVIALVAVLLRAIKGVANGILAQYPLDVVDNLDARRIHTQTRVLMRSTMTLVLVLGLAAVLMTFPSVRTVGASLLASAGLAGLVAAMAARPVLGNLIAGVQIAMTQPIRLDDVLIVEGEWGWVEEINGTYVVLRIWDRRRLIVPLQYFVEHPFQNWTRKSADIIGSVFWWVDYRMPLEPIRAELKRLCAEVPHWWDGDVAMLQVTDSSNQAVELRALVTARNSPDCWDLRCHVREGIIDFMQRQYPQFLPRHRAEIDSEKNRHVQPHAVPDRQPELTSMA